MAKYWGIAWPDLWSIKFSSGPTGNAIGSATIPAELTTPVIQAYQAKGCDLFRLAFVWKFLQPTLFGALDTAYLNRIIYSCQRAAEQGAKVIVDCHEVNLQYGDAYYIGSAQLPYTALTDLWQRLTQALKNNALAWQGVFALEIMNEPGQTNGTWLGNHTPTGSGYRAGIQGIRNVDANVKILVSGESYSGTNSWSSLNNSMVLPDANCIVVGHCYFDAGFGGTYHNGYANNVALFNATGRYGTTPGEEGASVGSATGRLDNWLNWLALKGYKGMVTEFGLPYNNGTATDWQAIFSAVFAKLDAHPNVIGATVWTGGGYGTGMQDSWQYNGAMGIGPYDDPGYASGPSNGHWNVMANYPTADFNDVTPPPPPPTGVVDLYVYRESYENNFTQSDQFNGGSATTASPAVPYHGTSALAITLGGAVAGVTYTTNIAFNSNDYDNLILAVYPTGASPATRDIGIAVIDSTGTGLYGSKQNYTVPAQTWTLLTIDLQTLCGGVAKSLLGFNISDNGGAAQPLLYADDVYFQAFGTAASAAPFVTISASAVGVVSAVTAAPLVSITAGPVVASISGLPTALSVFSENYDNGFIENGSFPSAGITAVAFPQSPYAGAAALGITFPSQFAAAVIRRATPFSSSLYGILTLTIYSTEVRYIGVSLIDASGAGLWGSKYTPPQPIPAATWTTLNIPISTLTGGQAVSLSGVAISDQSPAAGAHPQMYVDAFGFTAFNATAAPVVSIVCNPPGTAVVNASAAPLVTIACAPSAAIIGFGSATALAVFSVMSAAVGLTVLSKSAAPLVSIVCTPVPAADTVPPILSSVTPNPSTGTTELITWTTNEPSDSQVEYGLTVAYGQSSPLYPALVTNHAVLLTGLSPQTTYHYRVKSRDAAGNLVASN